MTMSKWTRCIIAIAFALFLQSTSSLYADDKEEPVIVNGDRVEYFEEEKKVVGTGNVVVTYKQMKLTADKATVYMNTKDAYADGNVTLYQDKNVLSGAKGYYNFDTKKGTLDDASGVMLPCYIKADKIDKISDTTYIATDGYVTTCKKSPPHYRVVSKKVFVYLKKRVVFKNGLLYVGKSPILYSPYWEYPLDDRPKAQMMPGRSKEWGAFSLNTWRYELSGDFKGTARLDYRENWGVGEGVDLKYNTRNAGEGLMRSYYTQQRVRDLPEGTPAEFERFRVQQRHKWQIDDNTMMMMEYNRFSDANYPKDFIYKDRRDEYEKDRNPETYVSVIESKPEYNLHFFTLKRVNRFDGVTQKLPEVKFNVPSHQIVNGGSGATNGENDSSESWYNNFYYTGDHSYVNFDRKYAAPTDNDEDVMRLDSYNELSYISKLGGFLSVTPKVGVRESFYTKDRQNDSGIGPREGNRNFIRGIFYTGFDMSTKLYKIYDVNINSKGFEMNRLRHVITPTIGYSYIHDPTVPASLLQGFDSIDSVSRTNSISFGLENKLQTKRLLSRSEIKRIGELGKKYEEEEKFEEQKEEAKGITKKEAAEKKQLQSVDIVRLGLSVPYDFKLENQGSRFGTHTVNLELLPYSWYRIVSDMSYNPHTKRIIGINSDFIVDFDIDNNWRFGTRYINDSSTQLTTEFNLRLSRWWKLRAYERLDAKKLTGTTKKINDLAEQEYGITRDLHCWDLDINYNIKREYGETLWFVLRLKAYPDIPFEFSNSYHQPKAGTQSSAY